MESLIEVPVITDEIRGDIEARIQGTYRTQLVEAETNAYRAAIAKAEADGQRLAAKEVADTNRTIQQDKLVGDALSQANKTAEHAYRTALREAKASHAARIDAEIAAEATTLRAERRRELEGGLQNCSIQEEREFVSFHANRLGIRTIGDLALTSPPAKKVRAEPKSKTAKQAAKDAKSRSSSVSSARKRGRSPGVAIAPSDALPPTEPSSCPPAEEDDPTPRNSPIEAGVTKAVMNPIPNSGDPLRAVGSSIHNPANRMAVSPPTPPLPLPNENVIPEPILSTFENRVIAHMEDNTKSFEVLGRLFQNVTDRLTALERGDVRPSIPVTTAHFTSRPNPTPIRQDTPHSGLFQCTGKREPHFGSGPFTSS